MEVAKVRTVRLPVIVLVVRIEDERVGDLSLQVLHHRAIPHIFARDFLRVGPHFGWFPLGRRGHARRSVLASSTSSGARLDRSIENVARAAGSAHRHLDRCLLLTASIASIAPLAPLDRAANGGM